MFVLFGAFLSQSGAGDFIIGLARAVSRRLIGGPGYVAVLGSGLMGSISGSSVANVAATGVITIPMMQRAGFPAKFAAAVEAAASTGGQIMPPVMGAGAFIMASYTNIPYLTIAAVAALPRSSGQCTRASICAGVQPSVRAVASIEGAMRRRPASSPW